MNSQPRLKTAASLALAVLMIGGMAPADAAVIKLMTYNVQSPGWNQNRRAQVVGTIDFELPDVLGLHEVSATSNRADLAADLMDDYEPFFTETTEPIYLRRDRSFQVLDQGVESLPTSGGSAVELVWLNVEAPDGARFVFYNAHFSVTFGNNDPLPNQMQAIATAEFMAAQAVPGTTNFLAGDLNASQTTPTIQYLLEGEPLDIDGELFNNPISLSDSWELAPSNAGLPRPGTGATSGGSSVLDWIMTDPFADVLEAEVIELDIPAGEADNFSDHLPVTATLDILPNIEFIPGDFNGDGFVDDEDLLTWQQDYGTDYDGGDFLVWQSNFGNGKAGGNLQTVSSVPEPNGSALVALGLALCGGAPPCPRSERAKRRGRG